MGVLQKYVGVREKETITAKKVSGLIIKHLGFMGTGLLFSLSGFKGDFSPFGIAFVAAVSEKFTLSAALGATAGYFLSLDSLNALRYTSTILALCVILGALKVFKQIRTSIYTPVITTFL